MEYVIDPSKKLLIKQKTS